MHLPEFIQSLLQIPDILRIDASRFIGAFCVPVSYTHLDVYKRQEIQGVIIVGQGEETNVAQELEEYVVTRELQRHFADFFAAVSYTHLDVYKRQLSARS